MPRSNDNGDEYQEGVEENTDDQYENEETDEGYEEAGSASLSIYSDKLMELRGNTRCFIHVNKESRQNPDCFAVACDKQTLLLSNPLSGYHKTMRASRVFSSRDNNIKLVDSLEYLINSVKKGHNVMLNSIGQFKSQKSSMLFGNGYNGVASILISRLFRLYQDDDSVQFSIGIASVTKTTVYDLLLNNNKTEVLVTPDNIDNYQFISKHNVTSIDDVCKFIRIARTIGYDNISREVLIEFRKQTSLIVYLEISQNIDQEDLTNYMIFADLLPTEYLVQSQSPIIKTLEGNFENHPLTYLLKDLFTSDSIKAFIISLRPELEHADQTVQSLYFAGLINQLKEFRPILLAADKEYKSKLNELRKNTYQESLDHASLVDYFKEGFDSYPNEPQLIQENNSVHHECELLARPIMDSHAREVMVTRKWREIAELEEKQYNEIQEDYDILDNKYRSHEIMADKLREDMERIISEKKQLEDEIKVRQGEVKSYTNNYKKSMTELKELQGQRSTVVGTKSLVDNNVNSPVPNKSAVSVVKQ